MSLSSAPETPDRRFSRVLCVDDEAFLRSAITQALSALGHHVAVAGDGREALDQVMEEPGRFDTVVTDHTMPVMTGLELVRNLRKSDFRGRIIVFASPLRPGEAAEYRALGIEHILEKPSGFSQLPQLLVAG